MYNYHLFTTLCIKKPYWSEAKMSIVHHQEVPIIYRRRNRIPALCLDIHTRTHIRLYYIMYYTLLYPVAIGEIDIYVCYFKFSPRPCSSLQSNLHQVWYNMVQHSDFDPSQISTEMDPVLWGPLPCSRGGHRASEWAPEGWNTSARPADVACFVASSEAPGRHTRRPAKNWLLQTWEVKRNTGKTGWKRGVNMTPN